MPKPRIYKYELEVTDAQTVRMPRGSTPLSVQDQNGTLCLWALCDIEQEDAWRYVYVIGTGHPADAALSTQYLGTVQTHGGRMVWHVFIGEDTPC